MLTLAMKLKDLDFESHWNVFSILSPMKHDVRFEYVPWKNFWFCFISIVWFPFSLKTGKFWFWKSLKYFNIFDKNLYDVRFKYVPWKNVRVCFISIVWVHFSGKTKKFLCLKSLKYFNFFLIKIKTVSDLHMPSQTVLDLV